ncbi:N-terminal double-transmembrane domain-containing protein [Aliiroseovarius halocynthiae]|uniref:DUF4159 domain-containing protein n=1 Tax=Aliiroseovarius halocynthiae TaxID=985055 RepID=A0A545SU99_9RHOB|nr:DUF4159 domain-containing protein [Aliiroseovarius halocynthiae]TQV68528.1 DUF4159 domain-containing protein [Aliiroseovarius halocynthiae]SMR70931.1 N-terminal double-transmembrane domain-containing protein [Aliiroseovarius halocynthiae]
MNILGIGFTAPLLLFGLLVLPIIWWLLRAVPPAPRKQVFPAVTLLLGLEDKVVQADRTPWWLLLLRLLAMATIIIGFAGPVLNPDTSGPRDGRLLVFVDDFWPAASDWPQRVQAIGNALDEAGVNARPTAIVLASSAVRADAAPNVDWQPADVWESALPGLAPVAWDGAYDWDWVTAVGDADVLWLSDGVARAGREDLIAKFEQLGQLDVREPSAPRLGILPAVLDGGDLVVSVLSTGPGPVSDVTLEALGPDPEGIDRALLSASVAFDAGARRADLRLTVPSELRNRIDRIQIANHRASGAVTLADDSLRRRKVGLLNTAGEREGLELLSPLHYLREALVTTSEVIELPALTELIKAGPDVVILPDVANFAEADRKALVDWVDGGGLLLRFAGPRLAASDLTQREADELLPVRLRAGGRVVGGAMSWGDPRVLAPFQESSPFFGLPLPDDVQIEAQILAQPGPDLAERTIATLSDGTPIVTRNTLGAGQIVLFHISANAEWSTLPLSGLFVQMLERLAIASKGQTRDSVALDGTTWVATHKLDGFGILSPEDAAPGVPGPKLVDPVGPDLAPGLYADGDRVQAVNVLRADSVLDRAVWPARVEPRWDVQSQRQELGPWLLALALLLGALDVVLTLWLAGRLFPGVQRGAASALVGLALVIAPQASDAQTETPPSVLDAANIVTLAHVLTGDTQVDQVARAGLLGLTDQLYLRSSVEPAPPVGVDIEIDDLSVYPMLYWPLTDTAPIPSPDAILRLKRYLAAGGLILFDTRDAGVGGGTAASRRLRSVALPLNLPLLDQVPYDHVLTRSFYLLQEFPGRYRGPVWAEAALADAEQVEGMPFRNLNDGVTPVIVGGNDWASAWAIRADGRPMFPVGRGQAGERQREMAVRFGVNLVMHVLTGNYKSDQVHVPALLERLGE